MAKSIKCRGRLLKGNSIASTHLNVSLLHLQESGDAISYTILDPSNSALGTADGRRAILEVFVSRKRIITMLLPGSRGLLIDDIQNVFTHVEFVKFIIFVTFIRRDAIHISTFIPKRVRTAAGVAIVGHIFGVTSAGAGGGGGGFGAV